jgi:hypothetical protein
MPETHRVANFRFYLFQGAFRKHTTTAPQEAEPAWRQSSEEKSLSKKYK